MAKYLPLPDGSSVTIREGETPQQAWMRAMQEYPDAFGLSGEAAPPAQRGSWLGDVGRSFGMGATGATGAITSIFGADNVAAERLREAGESLQEGLSPARQAELQRQAERMQRAEESGSTWEEIKAGLLNVLEAPVQSTAQALGSFAPMVATIPLAKLGLGARAIMAVRGAIGGAQGAGMVKQSVYEAVLAAEKEDGKSDEEAKAAAVRAQSYTGDMLDQIMFGGGVGVLAGTTGVERILPGGVRARGAMQQGLSRRIGARPATAITTALGEMPVEAVQGGQERLAANLALQRTGRDVGTFTGVAGQATQEALMAGFAASALGASMPDRRQEQAEELQRQQEQAARAETARLARQEQEAYEQSPQYLLDFEQQFLSVRNQLAALQQQKRKVSKDSPTVEEDREFNRQLSEQISNLREETDYKGLLEQYTRLKPRIDRAREQAALEAMSPEEFMLRQQGLDVDTRRPPEPRQRRGLSAPAARAVDTTGMPAQPMQPEQVPLFYAQQQIEAANQQAIQQAIDAQPELAMAGMDAAEGVQATGNQIIDALTTDLVQARALVRERPQLPGMSRAQSNLILNGLRDRLDQIGAQIEAGRQEAQARREAIEGEIQALRDMRERTDGADVARMRQLALRERALEAELAQIQQQAEIDQDTAVQLGLFESGLAIPDQETPAGLEAVPLSRRRRIGNVEVDGALPLPQQIRQLRQQRAAAVQTRNNALVRDIDEAIDILQEGEPTEREAAPTGQVADLQAALADMARSTEPEPQGPVPQRVPETTSPAMLEDLIARADQNPALPLQDQMLLEQVRDELPVLNRMQPVSDTEGVTPARPLDIVASWLYRSNTGNPSPEARQEVESLLARVEQGKRSETEQVRQATGRALTPQEQRQVSDTSLEGRRGIMTREDTGETRRQIQEDFLDQDIGTIFQDFADFDNYLASERLAELRDSQELFGETAARTAKLVAPLQNKVAEINTQLEALRRSIRAERAAAANQRMQARILVDEERAKVAKIFRDAEKPLEAFENAYLQAYSNLAEANTNRLELAQEMRDNAVQLEERIAAFETNQANKQALQKATKDFRQAFEALVTARQKEQDALRVLNTSRFPDYQAFFKAKEGRVSKEGLAELQTKAETAHKALAAAFQRVDPNIRLDGKVFKDFLIKEAALTEQLRATARRLGGLTTARNRNKKVMLEALAEVYNDPALVNRIEKAKLDEQTADLILQSAIANEAVDVSNYVRTLEQQMQELQPLADTLTTRINELNEAIRLRRDARAPRRVQPTTEGERRIAEQARLETLQGTSPEQAGLMQRIQVTFPREREKRVEGKRFFELFEAKEYTRIRAAMAPASEKAAAQQTAQEAQQAYDDFVNGMTEAEKKRTGAMNKAAKSFIVRDREIRKTKQKIAELQDKLAQAQAAIAERTEAGLAPLDKQTKQVASLENRISAAQSKQAAQQRAVTAALNKFQRVSGVQATYRDDMPPVRPIRTAADAAQEIEAIAAGQTQARATSPVVRGDSPAPAQLRTGTPESREGRTKAEVDRKARETTKAVPGTRPISKKEMAEANRLADVIKMTPDQKVSEEEAAAAIAREVQKRMDRMNAEMEKARQKRIKDAEKAAEKAKKGTKDFKRAGTRATAAVGSLYSPLESAVRGMDYESRPTFDLREGTAEAVRDGRILDALSSLQRVGSTEFVRELATRLRPLMMRTKLRVVDGLVNEAGVPVEGLYEPATNTTLLDRNGLNEESLLHELTHAATINALRADPASLTPDQQQALQDLRTLFEQAQADTTFQNEYALSNIEEFVAELMSNQKVRNKLDSMKPARQPSLLQRVYEAILRMVGIQRPMQSQRAVDAAYALFAPSKPSKGAVVASVTRGVFPKRKPVFNADVPESFRTSLTSPRKKTTFGDRMSAFALGMRIKTADQWAARESLLKAGLKGNKLDEAAVTQSRILMRLNSEANRFVHQAVLDAPLAIVKDEKGLIGVGVAENKASYSKVLEKLRTVQNEIGNTEAVENVFQKMLQIERAETDGVGYFKLNMQDPPATAAQARKFKEDLASKPAVKKAFDEARELYREYNDTMLDFAYDAGVFSKNEVSRFKKGNYVPFYRLNEQTGDVILSVGGTTRTVGNVINQPQLKELVGGENDFVGLTESVLQNTQLLTRMAMQNLQARDVGTMLKNLGLGTIREGEGVANTIRFKENGKNKWVQLQTDLFPPDIPAELLLQGLHGVRAAVPMALQAAGLPTRLLRSTIVRMPLYIIRQMIRDPLHAWFTTGVKFTPVVDSVKELTKIRKGLSETEVKLMRSGAISSNVMAGDYSDAARTLRDLTAKGVTWDKTMQALDNMAIQADASTRAVLYDKYREQGMSHFEAALGAAEVMNFSRRGTSSSLYMMSTLVPFFNAQIQGVDTIYRGFKGDTVFENQLKVRDSLIRRSLFMLGVTMAYSMVMQDDEAYKNATVQERAMNWFLRIPGIDATVRIPIPFEIGILTKSIPEALFNAAYGDDTAKDTMKALAFSGGMSIPSPIPVAVAPILELATNYSFFREAPIESARDRAVAPELRYRETTTELAKLLGKTAGVSPIQIEHLVRGYTSTAGILAMSLFNPILRPFAADERGEKVERRITEAPFFGAAFQPDTGRGLIDSVYADVQDWQQAASTYKRLVQDGRIADAKAFADKNSREIALSSTGGSFRQMMGQIAQMRRAIEADPRMSAKEKRDQIEDLKRYQIRLAQKIRELSRASE